MDHCDGGDRRIDQSSEDRTEEKIRIRLLSPMSECALPHWEPEFAFRTCNQAGMRERIREVVAVACMPQENQIDLGAGLRQVPDERIGILADAGHPGMDRRAIDEHSWTGFRGNSRPVLRACHRGCFW